MKSLSKQQRDYFIDRIKGEVNKEIAVLEQIHATNIETVANKQYKAYLKETGLDKLFKEYASAEEKWNKIRNRMESVCKALHEKTDYPGKDRYFHAPYDTKGVEKFLREICNALARDNFINTPKGKRLKELENKRTAAIDTVMGMTETEPLVQALNKILKGTNVPLLGGKNG
jgi:tRNA U54 and U55 pseudouridine synthase Pus10